MVGFLGEHEATFDVRAQLCTDLDAMPIEDATVVWPEEQSPHRTVARLILPAQMAYSEGRVHSRVDD